MRGTADRASAKAADRWRFYTLAPALAVYLLLALLPIVNLATMSVHDIHWQQGAARWTLVGMKHYAELPRDVLVRAGLANTALFALVAVTAEMLIGFALALFVSRIAVGRVLYRTIFLLPILLPGIVIGAIWKLMYNPDFGVINQLLHLLGLPGFDWLGSGSLAFLSVIIVDVWHWTPFVFLLLLAGLETLPQDIHEAAMLDGASAWQELRDVTIPMMVPILVMTLAFRLIVSFKVFDEVYLLTGGGPGTATEVLSFTIYRRFFTEDRMGYGSAISVIALFLLTLVIVLFMGMARRRLHAH
ncbi:MAG: sugar ABC transporter permease [Betaproteobacteria bacterium]|nr:sugar ABC transporter permease [Betaproteobacteria bacterium]